MRGDGSCAVACAGAKTLAEFVFTLFVLFQDFAGSFDDAAGEACEPRYFYAIALAGAAGFDVAEEDDFVGGFFYGDVDVLYAW